MSFKEVWGEASDIPISIKHLGEIGQINNVSDVTMETDKFIVARSQIENSFAIYGIGSNSLQSLKKFVSVADSVIMHPQEKIVAFNKGNELRLCNIEEDTVELKRICRKGEDVVVFWRWINEETIGLVTEAHVYHWTLTGTAAPRKVFKRHQSLTGCKIIEYRANKRRDFMVLIGESTEVPGAAGRMQLYNATTHLSQPLEGDTACFVEVTMAGNKHPSNLFVSSRRNEEGGKVLIMEIGTRPIGNQPYPKKSVDVPHIPELVDDYPKFIQASSEQGVAYIVTKHGFVHILDLESGRIIYSNGFSTDPICITVELSGGGIIGINEKGKVISVSMDVKKMLEFVAETNPILLEPLMKRWEKHIPFSSSESDSSEDEVEKEGEESRTIEASSDAPPVPSLRAVSLADSAVEGEGYAAPSDTIPHAEETEEETDETSRCADLMALHSVILRAETAEQERDDVMAQFAELKDLSKELISHTDRAEKDRDDAIAQYTELKGLHEDLISRIKTIEQERDDQLKEIKDLYDDLKTHCWEYRLHCDDLEASNTKLLARAVRAEQERDELLRLYNELESKRREAMSILEVRKGGDKTIKEEAQVESDKTLLDNKTDTTKQS